MNHLATANNMRDGAILRISGGSTRRVAANRDIRLVAADNTSSVDSSGVVDDVQEEGKSGEKKMLLMTLGISLGVALLVILAVKYKVVKL